MVQIGNLLFLLTSKETKCLDDLTSFKILVESWWHDDTHRWWTPEQVDKLNTICAIFPCDYREKLVTRSLDQRKITNQRLHQCKNEYIIKVARNLLEINWHTICEIQNFLVNIIVGQIIKLTKHVRRENHTFIFTNFCTI